MNESWVTFDGLDVWDKEWSLSNSNVPVAKRKQQGGYGMML